MILFFFISFRRHLTRRYRVVRRQQCFCRDWFSARQSFAFPQDQPVFRSPAVKLHIVKYLRGKRLQRTAAEYTARRRRRRETRRVAQWQGGWAHLEGKVGRHDKTFVVTVQGAWHQEIGVDLFVRQQLLKINLQVFSSTPWEKTRDFRDGS